MSRFDWQAQNDCCGVRTFPRLDNDGEALPSQLLLIPPGCCHHGSGSYIIGPTGVYSTVVSIQTIYVIYIRNMVLINVSNIE